MAKGVLLRAAVVLGALGTAVGVRMWNRRATRSDAPPFYHEPARAPTDTVLPPSQ